MKQNFDPVKNYEDSRKEIGYVNRKEATQKDYDRIGFMSGLEVHQQLLTKEKLFCRCPAGKYNSHDDYDAEIVRHMRPTLSELGEYDGTALMEFKTKKEIIYRINNDSACTYDVDDTPPFRIAQEALDIAIEISLLSKLNIVGEVHITRKQYLDGSIPTGFQRTAIIGVEGEIQLQKKKIRLIQLSLEEDSCREISDIGHTRIYKTDRLGMPLIETVTYPEMVNPDEVMEACNYIRFLNRSTGKVRVGIGAGREDVNVSCKGGTRVEIKGVARSKWIPELTHVECFRQWALLNIRKKLKAKIKNTANWKVSYEFLDFDSFSFNQPELKTAKDKLHKIVAIKLPGFGGILSHFTQPGKMFADEYADRLKVIACLERPNMAHSEQFEDFIAKEDFAIISGILSAKDEDAIIVVWGPADDVTTAIETIEERSKMAFEGVPNETRKSFADGTTIFERVLPGADRMYPDTDSAPIPLENQKIEQIGKNIPKDIVERISQLKKWKIPEDTYTYLLRNNLVPMIERITKDLKIDAKFAGTFLGHRLKNEEGKHKKQNFDYNIIYGMFKYIRKNKLDLRIAFEMLPIVYVHPKMEFDSVLTSLKFVHKSKDQLIAPINFLKEKFKEIGNTKTPENEINWVMGELRKHAIGNINLKDLSDQIAKN